MAVSESIISRRDYLVQWIKQELKSIPVSVFDENENVSIRFQEILICGVEVLEETYKVFNASDDWKSETTYHCEQADDGTWYYYLESADECIAECKRLVMFEIKKSTKKVANSDFEYNSAPIYSDYWYGVFRKLLGNIVKENMSGYVTEHGKDVIRFECYGTGAPNRMRVYLNKPNNRNPEIISVWVGANVYPSNLITPGSGDFKNFEDREECNNKFYIYPDKREQLIKEAYEFVKDMKNKIQGIR